MYIVNIEIGPFTEKYKGDDPNEIIREIESEQDFDCLLRMGRMQESEEYQGELDKLEAFLDKYHDESLTIEDSKHHRLELLADGRHHKHDPLWGSRRARTADRYVCYSRKPGRKDNKRNSCLQDL